MRRSTIISALLGAVLASLASSSASAVTGSQLQRGQARTLPMLVFDSSGKAFIGTELNVRGDVFNGQPCPKDPPTYEYTHLAPVFGIDYWACHHFDSDHT